MATKNEHIPLTPQLMQDFQQVYGMILSHRRRAAAAVDGEMLLMIWEVGGYVSLKLKSAVWGDGVVRQLSDFIRTQDPTSRGWSYRTIYKMVQLYEAYSRNEFTELVSHMNVSEYARLHLPAGSKSEFVPIEIAQIGTPEIVPFEMAQFPNVLFSTGWTNHQIILSRCKTDEERLFYMLYAKRERLENKQLERAIKTDTMTSLLSARDMQSETLQTTYPDSRVLFKDIAYVDFLGLPKKYKESKLRKGIIEHMKQFVLEIGGRDFLFIDDEHVLELKWNRSADTAIAQIKRQEYAGALFAFSGEILLEVSDTVSLT